MEYPIILVAVQTTNVRDSDHFEVYAELTKEGTRYAGDFLLSGNPVRFWISKK